MIDIESAFNILLFFQSLQQFLGYGSLDNRILLVSFKILLVLRYFVNYILAFEKHCVRKLLLDFDAPVVLK